jgi:hypothetical protein
LLPILGRKKTREEGRKEGREGREGEREERKGKEKNLEH